LGQALSNLRSSRQTELMKEKPIHLVLKHYLQVTNEDFNAAAGTSRERITTFSGSAEGGAQSGAEYVG
jgi:hypothetical protein